MTLRKLHTRLAVVTPTSSTNLPVDIFQPTKLCKSQKQTNTTPRFHLKERLTSPLEKDLQPAMQGSNGEFLAACPQPNIMDILKWRFSREKNQVPCDKEILDSTLPVWTPDFNAPIPKHHARITWLGHASVLLEIPLGRENEKMTFLTDAVFSDRCSPSQYFGPKRYRPCPVDVTSLPHVDAVLISHNHYDHLDLNTLESLYKAQPHLHWFVPLNNAAYLSSVGIPLDRIHQQNWWDTDPLSKCGESFRVSCVPAKHWSKRGVNDTNKALCGGWVVQGLGGSFYFVGDTAYDSFFKAIHHKYGEQSISAIPIGAYAPRHLFTYQHVNVQEAVQIHHDVHSRASLGIHWGTWELTDEHYLEPKVELENQMKEDPSRFFTLNHGAQRILPWKL